MSRKIVTAKDIFIQMNKDILQKELSSALKYPIKKLEAFFDQDYHAFIREHNSLKSKKARRVFLKPHKQLLEAIISSNSKIIKKNLGGSFSVIYGWLINGSNYKEGELKPGMTIEEIQKIQDAFSASYRIPVSVVESYLTYNGVSRSGPGIWNSWTRLCELSKAPTWLVDSDSFLILAEDGGGNSKGIFLENNSKVNLMVYDHDHEMNELYDIGHFDDLVFNNHNLLR